MDRRITIYANIQYSLRFARRRRRFLPPFFAGLRLADLRFDGLRFVAFGLRFDAVEITKKMQTRKRKYETTVRNEAGRCVRFHENFYVTQLISFTLEHRIVALAACLS